MIQIRPLEEQDVKAVSEIEGRSFSMPWKEADFLEMVKADYAYYYVAEENGVILGYCGLRNMAGEGEIMNVAVDAPFRRKGIARLLLEHTLEEAPKHGIGDCTLEVRVSNAPAIHLYEKFGFQWEGIRPNFYEKPKENAMIMWRRQSAMQK